MSDPIYDVTLGRYLQRRRLLRGWSQAEVGQRARLTSKTVHRLETGRSCNGVTLQRVCAVLGLELAAVRQELGGPPLGALRRLPESRKEWVGGTDGQTIRRRLCSSGQDWPQLRLRVACDPPAGPVRAAAQEVCRVVTRWQQAAVTPIAIGEGFQLAWELGDALRLLAVAGWELVGWGLAPGPEKPGVVGGRWWVPQWELELRPRAAVAPAEAGITGAAGG